MSSIASSQNRTRSSGRRLGLWACLALASLTLSSRAMSQQASLFVVTPIAEKRIATLPPGPLFWRIENFPSIVDAQRVEGPTALVVESAGRVWMFTLGTAGGSSRGGTMVAEVGPITQVQAPQYLLRISQAVGPPGSMTPVHTHPGSEAIYVVAGESTHRTPHGIDRVGAGQSLAGHGADMPMQLSSTGATDLLSLVSFVVDATRPFTSPATMP